MALMGWSNSAMAKRYQHVTGTIRADVAEQVGGLIWARNETRSATTGDQPDDSQPGLSALPLVKTAEAEGFEPPVPRGTLAFKASAIGRSATLPSRPRVTSAVSGDVQRAARPGHIRRDRIDRGRGV